MDTKERCREEFRKLTGKKQVVFTRRGNRSILLSLRYAKEKGTKQVLIQDQGGWLTYPQLIEKLGMTKTDLRTDNGLIRADELDPRADSAVLINSMPGYHALQDMDEIVKACSERILINDASGSIGTDAARCGDIIIGSFGKDKPINAGKGGFIASDMDHFDDELDTDYDELFLRLQGLGERLKRLQYRREKVITDLEEHDIVHRRMHGINVIVRFKDDDEKGLLESYCNKNDLEYTLCPRYIRILDDAVSIEVKRAE